MWDMPSLNPKKNCAVFCLHLRSHIGCGCTWSRTIDHWSDFFESQGPAGGHRRPQHHIPRGSYFWSDCLPSYICLRQCRTFPGLPDCCLDDLFRIWWVSPPAHSPEPYTCLYYTRGCCRRFTNERFPRRFHVERRNYSHCHSGLSVGSALASARSPPRAARNSKNCTRDGSWHYHSPDGVPERSGVPIGDLLRDPFARQPHE